MWKRIYLANIVWIKRVTIAFGACAAVCGLYAFSICWRVANAELHLYQRNHIFKTLNDEAHDYTKTAISPSHGDKTYEVTIDGRRVIVYKQLINGFQHAYGSAIAAFELGDGLAELAFRGVEYYEAYTAKGGRTYDHYLDTKKDLHNNGVGRLIAQRARVKRLCGRQADDFIQREILAEIARGDIISHFKDKRVTTLPSLEASGCWGLPHPKPDLDRI